MLNCHLSATPLPHHPLLSNTPRHSNKSTERSPTQLVRCTPPMEATLKARMPRAAKSTSNVRDLMSDTNNVETDGILDPEQPQNQAYRHNQ